MIAFLVAGTASGVGKTTTALALMAAFRKRGLTVQPFKCGPDFLDTSHHTAICGRPSRNLDTWMLDLESNRSIFVNGCRGADVAIVEGMMGLFDGVAGGGDQGSSAEIARQLGLPVILVLDASKSARSLAAVVKGFELFDPELRFAGAVLNAVAGLNHYRILEQAIVSSCTTPILGWLPRTEEVVIPERHLGLHSAVEQEDSGERLQAFAALAERNLKVDRLMQGEFADRSNGFARLSIAAAGSTSSSAPVLVHGLEGSRKIRVGVARDRAFSFYYADNFDILEEHGAEIVEFSPLADTQLPRELDAIYLGGGYPELHAKALSENQPALAGIRAFAAAGKPIYAECGGMMYLAETLTTLEGNSFALAGLLPLDIRMTRKLVHFGYAEVEFTADCLLGRKGMRMRGHSFHCSEAIPTGSLATVYRVHYSLSGRQEDEGYSGGSVLASYIHLHFRANPSVAKAFLRQALEARSAALEGTLL
jgi:cobyrinic acid a,c-diamide synthase